MTIALDGRLVFFASPDGLEVEREACRNTIDRYNHDYAHDAGVVFIPRGHEDVAGAVNRPQAEINLELHRADFVVVLLWNRWGTPSSTDGQHTSGTEEEFFEAAALLDDKNSPARDILVLFKSVDDQIQDADDQLRQVLAFRKKLEGSKEILFQTFDTPQDLERRLLQSLRKWTARLDPKVPRKLRLQPGRTTDIGDTAHALETLTVDEMLVRAEGYAREGLATQAEMAFAAAAESSRPDVLLEYARFMRRTGRLDRAVMLNEQMLALPHVAVSEDPEVITQRAEALANIGVVRRKQGDLRGAGAALDEAVRTARLAGSIGQDQLGFALDNLGLNQQRSGYLDAAARSFGEALDLRRTSGDIAGEAQSLLHLARASKLEGRLGDAAQLAETAVGVLEEGDDAPGLANGLSTLGDIRMLQGSRALAAEVYTRALEINQKLRNSDGVSIVNGQLARLWIEEGDLVRAGRHAEEARLESSESSNQEGVAVALELLGRIAGGESQLDLALNYFKQSIDISSTSGVPAREAVARLSLVGVLLDRGDRELAAAELVEAKAAVARAGRLPSLQVRIGELAARLKS